MLLLILLLRVDNLFRMRDLLLGCYELIDAEGVYQMRWTTVARWHLLLLQMINRLV
jgi:hypothetical protein